MVLHTGQNSTETTNSKYICHFDIFGTIFDPEPDFERKSKVSRCPFEQNAFKVPGFLAKNYFIKNWGFFVHQVALLKTNNTAAQLLNESILYLPACFSRLSSCF